MDVEMWQSRWWAGLWPLEKVGYGGVGEGGRTTENGPTSNPIEWFRRQKWGYRERNQDRHRFRARRLNRNGNGSRIRESPCN